MTADRKSRIQKGTVPLLGQPDKINQPDYFRSIIGQNDRFNCVRCDRRLRWDQFPPIGRTPDIDQISRVQLLGTMCRRCRRQLDGPCRKMAGYTPNLDAFIGEITSACKGRAYHRGLEYGIDRDDILELYLKQGKKCALTGIEMLPLPGWKTLKNKWRPSIDRIDSSKGYTIDNIQIVCAIVNIMKQDLPQSLFIKLCRQVVSHHADKLDSLSAAIDS